jgi:hypothetical protein
VLKYKVIRLDMKAQFPLPSSRRLMAHLSPHPLHPAVKLFIDPEGYCRQLK